uniref:Uncharacterized protein n=1 Tax=Balaenoptera musculus TaxID=9771 RepID=A0A8C0DXS3_BALMU
MIKFCFSTRYLFNFTNPDRLVPSNTLYIRHSNRFLISNTHLPRRKLWMTHSVYTCKWSVHILYLPTYSRRTWPILWVLHFPRNMKYWNYSATHSYSHCIHRLCITMRTKIILRKGSHYQPSFSDPIHLTKLVE